LAWDIEMRGAKHVNYTRFKMMDKEKNRVQLLLKVCAPIENYNLAIIGAMLKTFKWLLRSHCTHKEAGAPTECNERKYAQARTPAHLVVYCLSCRHCSKQKNEQTRMLGNNTSLEASAEPTW